MPLIPITINVYTGDPAPIAGVRVSIWTEDYFCVFDEYTDTNGQTALALEPGVYNVFLKKAGLSFSPMPKVIETIDTPITVSYEGVPQLFPSESNGTVYLYGDISDLTMNPIASAKVQVYLTTNPQTKSGSLLDKSILDVYTNESGRWGTLLPAGSFVTVVVLGSNFQRTGTLPFTGRINILDLV